MQTLPPKFKGYKQIGVYDFSNSWGQLIFRTSAHTYQTTRRGLDGNNSTVSLLDSEF